MATCKTKGIKNAFIKWFIKKYNVDMQDALISEATDYPDFNSFFIRQLKPESRPIAADIHAIASPADGCLSQFGSIHHQMLLQAKGYYYSVDALLGQPDSPFHEGYYATIYLAPRDYHRVHMPYPGTLISMKYMPGTLFSVNQRNAENIPNLFTLNERVICIFETDIGKMAVILVGAMIVGSIVMQWTGSITPPHDNRMKSWQYSNDSDQHIFLQKGAELGYFCMGSTVIVLFEKDALQWQPELTMNQTVKMGECLGMTKRV